LSGVRSTCVLAPLARRNGSLRSEAPRTGGRSFGGGGERENGGSMRVVDDARSNRIIDDE